MTAPICIDCGGECQLSGRLYVCPQCGRVFLLMPAWYCGKRGSQVDIKDFCTASYFPNVDEMIEKVFRPTLT